VATRSPRAAGRVEKAMSDKSTMHGSGESYSGVVPAKQPNKGGRPQAEVVEEGRWPRRTRNSQASAGRRSGKAGQTGWDVCGK
jgi:hypothetical protein